MRLCKFENVLTAPDVDHRRRKRSVGARRAAGELLSKPAMAQRAVLEPPLQNRHQAC